MITRDISIGTNCGGLTSMISEIIGTVTPKSLVWQVLANRMIIFYSCTIVMYDWQRSVVRLWKTCGDTRTTYADLSYDLSKTIHDYIWLKKSWIIIWHIFDSRMNIVQLPYDYQRYVVWLSKTFGDTCTTYADLSYDLCKIIHKYIG